MKKAMWKKPTMTEIGDIKSLVKSGAANGKSGATLDGNANQPGGEFMN